MTRIYTPSKDTLEKIRDDHFRLLRLVDDLQRHVQAIDGSDDNGAVFFLNSSGEQVPAGGVMRITDFNRRTRTFEIGKPNTSFERGYLVNGDLPVSDGATGWAYRMGECEVLYDDANTPAFGEGWGPQPGSWAIAKGYYGFTIHGEPDSDTGLVWAGQHVVNEVVGFLDGQLSQGATATLSVLGFGTALFDTTFNLTVQDWQLNLTESVAANTKLEAGWRANAWMALNPYCAASDTLP